MSDDQAAPGYSRKADGVDEAEAPMSYGEAENRLSDIVAKAQGIKSRFLASKSAGALSAGKIQTVGDAAADVAHEMSRLAEMLPDSPRRVYVDEIRDDPEFRPEDPIDAMHERPARGMQGGLAAADAIG